jgi:hypothetical protein
MGFFLSWPGLNEHSVEKYLSKSTSTTKGHLNQQRQNARTTKIKDAQPLDPATDQDHGIKTQYIYAATIDAGQIYIDQTGRFPIVSSRGNKYIMVLYDYDSNVILAKPIKDSTAPELLTGFSIYGTRTRGQRSKTKANEIGQRGIKIVERLPLSTRYYISISSPIQSYTQFR